MCVCCFLRVNGVVEEAMKRLSVTQEETQLTSGMRDGGHVRRPIRCWKIRLYCGFSAHFRSLLTGSFARPNSVKQEGPS